MHLKKLDRHDIRKIILEVLEAEEHKRKPGKSREARKIKGIIDQVLNHPRAGDFKEEVADVEIADNDVLLNLYDVKDRVVTDRDLAMRVREMIKKMKLKNKWIISPEAYEEDSREDFLIIASV